MPAATAQAGDRIEAGLGGTQRIHRDMGAALRHLADRRDDIAGLRRIDPATGAAICAPASSFSGDKSMAMTWRP